MTKVRDKVLLTAFGIHLRELRNKKGYSQIELARVALVSESQIGRIERGMLNPTLSSLYALARALNVPLPTLVEVEVIKISEK